MHPLGIRYTFATFMIVIDMQSSLNHLRLLGYWIRAYRKQHLTVYFYILCRLSEGTSLKKKKIAISQHDNSLIVHLLVSSADKFCKQFGPRSGPTKCRA